MIKKGTKASRHKGTKYLIVMLLVSFVGCSLVVAAEKSLRDELIQPTDAVYRTYGYSEEMLPLYNIWANQAAAKNYEIRIKKLEEQIAKLQKQLAEITEKINREEEKRAAPADSDPAGGESIDPNEVENRD